MLRPREWVSAKYSIYDIDIFNYYEIYFFQKNELGFGKLFASYLGET